MWGVCVLECVTVVKACTRSRRVKVSRSTKGFTLPHLPSLSSTRRSSWRWRRTAGWAAQHHVCLLKKKNIPYKLTCSCVFSYYPKVQTQTPTPAHPQPSCPAAPSGTTSQDHRGPWTQVTVQKIKPPLENRSLDDRHRAKYDIRSLPEITDIFTEIKLIWLMEGFFQFYF